MSGEFPVHYARRPNGPQCGNAQVGTQYVKTTGVWPKVTCPDCLDWRVKHPSLGKKGNRK